jgi:hypothetical protein
MCYRLQQRAPVMLVDEYLTSQISNATLERQTNLHRWKYVINRELSEPDLIIREKKPTLIWGIKQYNMPNEPFLTQQRYADRNRNASANMRDLGLYWLKYHDRPIQFKRDNNTDNPGNATSSLPKKFI